MQQSNAWHSLLQGVGVPGTLALAYTHSETTSETILGSPVGIFAAGLPEPQHFMDEVGSRLVGYPFSQEIWQHLCLIARSH